MQTSSKFELLERFESHKPSRIGAGRRARYLWLNQSYEKCYPRPCVLFRASMVFEVIPIGGFNSEERSRERR